MLCVIREQQNFRQFYQYFVNPISVSVLEVPKSYVYIYFWDTLNAYFRFWVKQWRFFIFLFCDHFFGVQITGLKDLFGHSLDPKSSLGGTLHLSFLKLLIVFPKLRKKKTINKLNYEIKFSRNYKNNGHRFDITNTH